MVLKTTVGIDEVLRKRIKKLAAWLDLTQGEVIRNAIDTYEKAIFSPTETPRSKPLDLSKEDKIVAILKQATEEVWAADPETREIQQRLLAESDTIDDYIVKKWRTGLIE
jgi:hypothetical protein